MQKQWELNWVDYYKVLEIDRDADAGTIKKKYRELAMQYHPDHNSEEGATEKFQDINQAYTVLSDEEEKKLYDMAWDARKNGMYAENNTTTAENNVSYEDVKSHYTAEEQRHAKKMALKKIIEEELKKTQLIIETKSDIIFSGYTGAVTKEEYYIKVKELVSVGFEFISCLGEYVLEAHKYDMLAEVELINQNIEYLEKELKDIPLSPTDAEIYMNEAIYKQTTEKKIKELLANNENIVNNLKNILIYVYEKKITYLEYRNILESILLEAHTNMNDLKQVYLISNSLGLDNYIQEISKAMGKLHSMMVDIPKDYDLAVSRGQVEKLKARMLDTISSWDQYGRKIAKIEKLLRKNPRDGIYRMLYNYGIAILDDYLKELELILKESNNIKYKNHTNIKDLMAEVVKVFEEAKQVHRKADLLYDRVVWNRDWRFRFGNEALDNIDILYQSVSAVFDKERALELLVEAGKISGAVSCLRDEGTLDLCKEQYSKITSIRNSFLSMYNMNDGSVYEELFDKNLEELMSLKSQLSAAVFKRVVISLLGTTPFFGYLLAKGEKNFLMGSIMFAISCILLYISKGTFQDVRIIKEEINKVKKRYKI